jgi:DNA polymerase-3 subunit delta'
MTLFSLLNQQKNLELLKNIILNQRVGNAYLFYGPEGSGNEGFALEFAAMLNCQGSGNIPCGTCNSCHKIRLLEHANLELVFPIPIRKDSSADADPFKGFSQAAMTEIQEIIRVKAQNPYEKINIPNAKHIPINFIRAVKQKTYLKSAEPGWKVIVIFDAHLMTEPAANAFLKILEEPPEKSTFILTTSNPNILLPTIISRCQPIYFPALASSVLKQHLLSRNIPEEQIDLIIRLSGGEINLALRLSETDFTPVKEKILDLLRSLATLNIEKLYNYVEDLAALYQEDASQVQQIILSLCFWFRDALILKEQINETELILKEFTPEIRKFVVAFPNFDAYLASSSVENCIDFINRNVYIKLALLNLFFNLNKAINAG